jgi:hypothetical protein
MTKQASIYKVSFGTFDNPFIKTLVVRLYKKYNITSFQYTHPGLNGFMICPALFCGKLCRVWIF